ncbi:hypothetical protein NDU88_001419 [Pleurodeles waltl]|uniref:SAP domain-containing protein n=1 Tax=Pleurodeles waltl TaxID=8319 RepID=A0AAV7S8X6_PLEWA|nr:hypothetical protein NDU88_001419 [Pleurodeles waltl]
MEDSQGQREVGGTPPTFRFWPRLNRRGQNAQRCTASLLAVLPPTSAMAVITARVRMTPIMSNAEENVMELDITLYLNLRMSELRSLCKTKKIRTGSNPTKVQLQELLAEFAKNNPSEDDLPGGEASDVEEFPPPVLVREARVPDTLTPQVIVRDAASLTGESSTSGIIEDSPNEEDLLLARMAKRLALDRQLLAIERERQEMGFRPINGGSNLNRVRDSPDMLKIPKGIVTKYEDGDDITKWFTAFERACATRKVNRSHWGALLWEMFTGKCRDRLLTLSGKDAESYDLMKATLIEGFGFSTEEYRIRFRGGSKILEPDLG